MTPTKMSKRHNPDTVWTLDAWIQRTREADDLRQRALDIKEVGDRRALELARDIQTYKDEQANELRSQIESERGTYITRAELQAAIDKVWSRSLALMAIGATLAGGGFGIYLVNVHH
jgi:hypothetical protein